MVTDATAQKAPPEDAPVLIRMDGVSKQFANGTVAVRDMRLDIREGEFISFLGPSGCGKSTALKMIAGLLSISAGEVVVNGHPPGRGQAHDIGFVFQDATLMPWATVFDNVFLPLRMKGVKKKEAREEVEEALASVGLSSFTHAYPRQLSGGMKMRVSIARAIVTNPRLILMDEPFAALDEITRHKLNNDLLTLKDQIGCTVIFVTHSVFESVFLSDRIVVMAARPGRVLTELQVDAPYPRGEDFRTSAEYAAHARRASEALKEAMGEPA